MFLSTEKQSDPAPLNSENSDQQTPMQPEALRDKDLIERLWNEILTKQR